MLMFMSGLGGSKGMNVTSCFFVFTMKGHVLMTVMATHGGSYCYDELVRKL